MHVQDLTPDLAEKIAAWIYKHPSPENCVELWAIMPLQKWAEDQRKAQAEG